MHPWLIDPSHVLSDVVLMLSDEPWHIGSKSE